MHPFSIVIPAPRNIIVSKHAMNRFRERFSKYFCQITGKSDELTYNLISAQVSIGRVCHLWTLSPFIKNKVDSNYGVGTVAIATHPCYYICEFSGKRLIVKTVVPRWECEPTFKKKK